jgi:hypothetical protein
MHMAEGGDAQRGRGGCTCILCIPPGYAPVLAPYVLGVLAGSDPDPDGLVIGAAGQERSVQRHPHHPHPVPAQEKILGQYKNLFLLFSSSVANLR